MRETSTSSRGTDESLSIRMLGGKLDERTSTVVGGQRRRSSPAPRGYPDVTANLTVSYQVVAWSVQLQERFIDDVDC